MVSIIVTLLMIALLIYGILKRGNVALLMIIISLFCIAGYTIFTGQSLLGSDSSGSKFIDLFQYIMNTWKGTMNIILVVMLMMGYVALMDYIKATKMLTVLSVNPLKKFKSPYVVVALSILLGAFFKMIIPSGIAITAIMISTVYPLLLAVGITRATAASAFVLAGVAVWGPTCNTTIISFKLANIIGASLPKFFATIQIPLVAVSIIPMCIAFIIVSKYYDKKEKAQPENSIIEGITAADIGVPKLFALLPIVPLVLVLIFSPLIISSITITIEAAYFISFLFTILVIVIRDRSFKEVWNGANEFFKGAANSLMGVGFLILASMTFANVMGKVGGLAVLAKLVGGSTALFTIGIAIIGLVTVAGVGVMTGGFPILSPIIGSYCAASGEAAEPYIAMMLLSTNFGYCFAPASSVMMMITNSLNVPFTTIIKRNTIPGIVATIFVIVGKLILF